MISIIVAVSDDLGIGKDNELLWTISDDLKRFKSLTYGNTVIMGKKTWESLPRKPLPGRKNIVLTDTAGECIVFRLQHIQLKMHLVNVRRGRDIHHWRRKYIQAVYAPCR